MTFPPPHPAAQNSVASGTTKSASLRPLRSQQSAWGLPSSSAGAARGLTPLSTDLSSDPTSRSRTSSASPFLPSFSSVVNSSASSGHSRGNYSASSNSPFPPLQSGSQQANSGHSLASPRSRTITPSSQSTLASSAAAPTTASQIGGGSSGGGGGSRSQTFSPSSAQGITSPTATTFDRSAFIGSASSSATSGQSSVSKIVVTQVFLLLGSITEKEGKAKWDSLAEQIRKVCFGLRHQTGGLAKPHVAG